MARSVLRSFPCLLHLQLCLLDAMCLSHRDMPFLKNSFFPLLREEGCFRVEGRVGGLSPAGVSHPLLQALLSSSRFPVISNDLNRTILSPEALEGHELEAN